MILHLAVDLAAITLVFVNLYLWRRFDYWHNQWIEASADYARALDREACLREALRELGCEIDKDGAVRIVAGIALLGLRTEEAQGLVSSFGGGPPGAAVTGQPLPGVPPGNGFSPPGPAAPVLEGQWFCVHGNAGDPCPVCFPHSQVVDAPGRALSLVPRPFVAPGVPHRPPPGDRERWAACRRESAADPPEVQS